MARPMLGDVELQLVQKIDTADEQVQAQHSVPSLEGDFLQGLGRRASRVTLKGVITGEEAKTGLKSLRDKFRAAVPVSFVADITTATKVEQVIIEEMGVRELAGLPERFEYALTLREYIPPPPPRSENPPPSPAPPPPPLPSVEVGTLRVEVIVEGQPDFDFSTVTLTVEGTQEDGTSLSLNLTNRADNVWTEENMSPGQYTLQAVVTAPQAMSGTAQATIRGGQTTLVTITLRAGVLIAKAFVVHFWFDKAFIEPCLRRVLRQVAEYAQAHSDEKLVIVGHTDLVGSDDYNQALSERRSRSVYAFLIFGRDGAAALAEWNELRKPATGQLRNIHDNWGIREYQYILQDLGYYAGNIDEQHGSQTSAAVSAFQHDNGLPETGAVNDATWEKLIEVYLNQDTLAVPESQFLPNAKDNCDGGILKWLGCGEKDPVKNTQDAWRPNRRTEMLFVKAERLPCNVLQPITFELPAAGVVGSNWCLGPGNPNQLCCFIARNTAQQGKWLVQPAEPGTITVRGSIKFDDGTPAINTKYVLIAPDGEFMDGEKPSDPNRGRPILGRTAADGTFVYPDKPKGIGVYTLEIQAPFVARLADQPPETAKGNRVCKRLDGTSDFNVVISRGACRLLGRVHFEFDKSFIRPAAKRTLRTLADSMQRGAPSRRLLLVGHTDMLGRDAYNNELGLRRTEAVFAFLTGNPPDPTSPGRSIWLRLYHDVRENWGASEIQYMLLDLGFYCHHLTNVLDAETLRAVRGFKNHFGLGDNDIINDIFLERLFSEYIAHNGASVPVNRFLSPRHLISCGERHPIDIRGGVPFPNRSEKNRRVEFFIFSQPPQPAPTSSTDCSQYTSWNVPCDRRWLDFVGPKRNPIDPADAEENLAFLEISNWENAFDYDPPDANGKRQVTGGQPRANFIDLDPDRFFVQIADLDRQGTGNIRAHIKTINDAGNDLNPFVEFELTEDVNDPGTFRSHSMLLVADEIDNGEINNGSAPGATPFQARGIANGALNDPLLRAEIGGHVVVEYNGAELGRISVCDPECIKTVPINVTILRKADGTSVTTEADVRERVQRAAQPYAQCCIRFNITIRTATPAEMANTNIILSDANGFVRTPGAINNLSASDADLQAALTHDEWSLFDSPLNTSPATQNTIEVFYVNHLDPPARATQYRIGRYAVPGVKVTNIALVAADVDESFTLPHELLHIFMNRDHSQDANNNIATNLFFTPAPAQNTFADTTVISRKRITEEQCEHIMTNVSQLVP